MHCPHCLAPCPIYTAPWPNKKNKINFLYKYLLNVIAVLCFQTANVKMFVKYMLICAHCPCFHQSATKLCLDLVSFACWIVNEFWSLTRKNVLDLVIRALNCAQFCVVCTLICGRILVFRVLDCAQFLLHPELAGTLKTYPKPIPNPKPAPKTNPTPKW